RPEHRSALATARSPAALDEYWPSVNELWETAKQSTMRLPPEDHNSRHRCELAAELHRSLLALRADQTDMQAGCQRRCCPAPVSPLSNSPPLPPASPLSFRLIAVAVHHHQLVTSRVEVSDRHGRH